MERTNAQRRLCRDGKRGKKKRYPTRVPCNCSLVHEKTTDQRGKKVPHQGSVLTPPGFRVNPTRVPCMYERNIVEYVHEEPERWQACPGERQRFSVQWTIVFLTQFV